MRTKGWVLLTATLLDGVGTGICFGQSDNVTTVMIEEVGGNVTATPSFASILSSSKAGTFRWLSRTRKARFRIEFIFANPCTPKTSHLDRTPATCHVLPNHQGTYMYRIVPKGETGESKGLTALARVGSCEACNPPTGRQLVGIACDRNGTAQAVPRDFTVTRGSAVQWIALGSDSAQWAAMFSKPSPCKENAVDAKSSVCSVTGPAGQYTYSIKLDGCASPGSGEITVK